MPTPRPNRGPPRNRSSEASPRIGASTMATFSPETTSRCPSPVAWKSRIIPVSSCDASPNANPEQQPGLYAGEEPCDRPADERSEHLRRTDEGARRRPHALDGVPFSSTTMPCVRACVLEPGSSGRRITPSAADQSPRTQVGGSSSALNHNDARKGDAAGPLHARDVERGMPSERPGLGIGVERSDDRHAGERAGRAANRRARRHAHPTSRPRAGPDRPSRARR